MSTGWLQRRTPRWRIALATLLVLLAVALGAALFTTFDSVSSEGTYCGSPLAPEVELVDGCAEELGHARATRTAALTWALLLLAGAWAVEAAGRRSDA